VQVTAVVACRACATVEHAGGTRACTTCRGVQGLPSVESDNEGSMPSECMPTAVEGMQGGAREPKCRPPQWWFAGHAPQWSTQGVTRACTTCRGVQGLPSVGSDNEGSMPSECMPTAVEGMQGGAREPKCKSPQWWLAGHAPQRSMQSVTCPGACGVPALMA
jgi:hypothetical protein